MTVPGKQLIVRYRGWAVVRLPTDPDPSDEPHGASGYTFSFAGEPPLDRIFRLQPEPQYVRPGPGLHGQPEWPWGVFVHESEIVDNAGNRTVIDGLNGAAVDMLGHPKLENRNLLLTYPGWEPFVPYELQIKGDGILLQRGAPLSTDGTPYWKLPTSTLMTIAARGVYLEHETIGSATGIWDATALYEERKQWLVTAIPAEKDPVKKQALMSRLHEVNYGLKAGPSDNRIGAHYAVERFDFAANSDSATAKCAPITGMGTLDTKADWWSSFFFGCFDADLLAAYVQGSLAIPFTAGD